MQLTRIEYLANGGAAIYIDKEKMAVINAIEVTALGLFTDMECDERLVSKIRAHARKYNARKRALACVAHADLSKKVLTRKLVEKGIDEVSATEAAGYLEKKGYLNELTLARRIVQAYGPEKCFGRRRVEQELYRRGIPKETAEEALLELPPDEELIAGLYGMRFLRIDITESKAKKRVFDALIRYGFSFEDIRREMEKHGSAEFEE